MSGDDRSDAVSSVIRPFCVADAWAVYRRRMRSRILLALVVLLGALSAVPTSVAADAEGDGSDQNPDRGIPGPAPVDDRPLNTASATTADTRTNDVTIFSQTLDVVEPRVGVNPIEDFRYDKLELEGTAREICVGRLGTGTGWAFNEVVSRFGGVAGTMYVCRERWDAANDPDCNGTVVNPATNPNFSSGCWSNHARGRAFDVMVGRQGSGYNNARGIAIVNWLIASSADGSVNSNARQLGIQQILFNDRCWNSEGDRGITSWETMRRCTVGHQDHIHVDMTIPGAAGNVAYWGGTPWVAPRIDTQVFWDWDSSYRQAISWHNLRARDEEGVVLPPQYDRGFVGDFDGDGIEDDTFLWDSETGNWVVQTWTNGDSLNARIGTWSRNFDEIYVGDFDGDGRVDDMIVWDRDSGKYGVQSWSNFEPRFRGQGYWSPGYEMAVVADLDGDGSLNDILLWDRDTGKWAAFSWNGFRQTYRALGYWGRGTDIVLAGDWSAGGEVDEILLWDLDSGRYVVQSWSGFRPRSQVGGQWSTKFDYGAPGDYDSDGRVDDIFLYDVATGQWSIYSFHRSVASLRLSQDWMHGYDQIGVGSFMD